jgi:hypothetical protein
VSSIAVWLPTKAGVGSGRADQAAPIRPRRSGRADQADAAGRVRTARAKMVRMAAATISAAVQVAMAHRRAAERRR